MAFAFAPSMQIPQSVLLSLLAFHLTVLEHAAWAGWTLALPGRVDRVVATDKHAAAIRGRSVVLLNEDGSITSQLTEPEIESRARSASPDGRAREELLDFLGIDESEQDNSWVEDELNNESTLTQRRLRREGARQKGTVTSGPPAIAASAHDLWIANGRGLWYWPGSGSLLHVANRAVSGALISAATDGQVLLATGNQIFLFTMGEGLRTLMTSAPVQQIAASPSGTLAWASGTEVGMSEGDENQGRSVALSQPAHALRFCGEPLVLLTHDGLAELTADGRLALLAPRLSARRLACPDGVGPWVAAGPDLLVSEDQGHTWTTITPPVRVRVLDAALGKDCLWVATDRGLYRVSGQPSPDDPISQAPGQHQSLLVGPGIAPWWAAWLPQLTVSAGALVARGRRDIQTVALASFPLDSPTPRRSFRLVADNTEVPVTHEPHPIEMTLPPDPEADCLTAARTKAVSLAMVEPDRARSYVDRARHAAWLPELRLRVDRRFGRSESLDVPSTSTATTSPLGVDTVDDVRYEARVTWDLARLVFSNDELAAQAQTMHMAEMRRDIEVTVSRLYFERRRLRTERLTTGTLERSLRRDLRVREIEAELDALSAGGFSECIAGRAMGQGAS
jgi:hypothetical protein